jgi:hypothetical protein
MSTTIEICLIICTCEHMKIYMHVLILKGVNVYKDMSKYT